MGVADIALCFIGFVAFFILGVKAGVALTFFSKFDFDTEYNAWLVRKGYKDPNK